MLHDFVAQNKIITEVRLEETLINPALITFINKTAAQNSENRKEKKVIVSEPGVSSQRGSEEGHFSGLSVQVEEDIGTRSNKPSKRKMRPGDGLTLITDATAGVTHEKTRKPDWWHLSTLSTLIRSQSSFEGSWLLRLACHSEGLFPRNLTTLLSLFDCGAPTGLSLIYFSSDLSPETSYFPSLEILRKL
eukprot:TRINITY_DN10875_c0_g1_i1.p1 TRINITY_DN10875_c0_g1~~TRINITY_DN10875_c0_g1_i1.p1  ORF type:complete len:190 (+),score=7.40 TRINITY_DN10875_c0_g1_i1:358-927(+)